MDKSIDKMLEFLWEQDCNGKAQVSNIPTQLNEM